MLYIYNVIIKYRLLLLFSDEKSDFQLLVTQVELGILIPMIAF